MKNERRSNLDNSQLPQQLSLLLMTTRKTKRHTVTQSTVGLFVQYTTSNQPTVLKKLNNIEPLCDYYSYLLAPAKHRRARQDSHTKIFQCLFDLNDCVQLVSQSLNISKFLSVVSAGTSKIPMYSMYSTILPTVSIYIHHTYCTTQ